MVALIDGVRAPRRGSRSGRCRRCAYWTVDLWIPPAAEGDAGRRVVRGHRAPAGGASSPGQLEELHPTASFLDDARHFIVPAGDDVVEVLAWELRWRRD